MIEMVLLRVSTFLFGRGLCVDVDIVVTIDVKPIARCVCVADGTFLRDRFLDGPCRLCGG